MKLFPNLIGLNEIADLPRRVALVGLGLTFLSLILYGVVKSCRNGTCNKPVESG